MATTTDFQGKTVLITGAGKGIGRATAHHLADHGAAIVALSRSAEDLETLQAEIGCRTVIVDLADDQATHAAGFEALPADFLVNCAGVVELAPFLSVDADTFNRVMAVNCRAPMLLSQIYAKHRIDQGLQGAIVNVSSIASTMGFPDHAAYSASKGALDGLTRVMANELGRQGIRVNAVNPGITLTPMAEKAWSDPAKSAPMLARMPLGRFVQPAEVASVIAYLLSDAASMVNGICMPVEGGFLIN